MYSVLLFLSPLQYVAILGSGAKVAAAIYSKGRCVDPGARRLGWAWGCLHEGGQECVLQSDVCVFWFFSVALPFYFNCWLTHKSVLNFKECQWQ